MPGVRMECFAFTEEHRARIRAAVGAVSDEFLAEAATWVHVLNLEEHEPSPAMERDACDGVQEALLLLMNRLNDLDAPHAQGALWHFCHRAGAPTPSELVATLRRFSDAFAMAEREIPEPRPGRLASRARIELHGRIAEEARRLGCENGQQAAPLFREVLTAAGLPCADPERVARDALKLLRRELSEKG